MATVAKMQLGRLEGGKLDLSQEDFKKLGRWGEQNWLVFLSVRGSQTQKWLLVQLQQRLDSNSRLVKF